MPEEATLLAAGYAVRLGRASLRRGRLRGMAGRDDRRHVRVLLRSRAPRSRAPHARGPRVSSGGAAGLGREARCGARRSRHRPRALLRRPSRVHLLRRRRLALSLRRDSSPSTPPWGWSRSGPSWPSASASESCARASAHRIDLAVAGRALWPRSSGPSSSVCAEEPSRRRGEFPSGKDAPLRRLRIRSPMAASSRGTLGVADSALLVVGSIVGAGIFFVSPSVAQAVKSPGGVPRRLAARGRGRARGGADQRGARRSLPEVGRRVRVPARSVRSGLRLPQRVDELLDRVPRIDRRARLGLRHDARAHAPHRPVRALRSRSAFCAIARAHGPQLARPAGRQVGAERPVGDQARGVRGPARARPARRRGMPAGSSRSRHRAIARPGSRWRSSR